MPIGGGSKADYGNRLLKRRGELIERSFAHCYETGAMRRVYLRGHENVLKRQLIHVGAFNLSLIFRQKLGAGYATGAPQPPTGSRFCYFVVHNLM